MRDAERLIALQGGSIQVERHPHDGGSTVLLRLPEPLPQTRGANGPAVDPAPLRDSRSASSGGVVNDVAGMIWGP